MENEKTEVKISKDRLDAISNFLKENEDMLKQSGRYTQAPDMDYVIDLLFTIIDDYKCTLEERKNKEKKLYQEIEHLYFFKVASLHPLLHLSINKEVH